jgi:hypothetical protein
MQNMESLSKYPCMAHQAADIRMTYERTADVWAPYWRFPSSSLGSTTEDELQLLRTPPIPFKHKRHAIFHVCNEHSSNDRSGRQNLARNLSAHLSAINSSLAVHTYGSCASANVDAASNADFRTASNHFFRYEKKVDFMRKYKFCLVLENSLDKDYVTEKIYHALIAGCLPVYYGASNFAAFIPDVEGVVDYSAVGGAQQLANELDRLAGDEAAYANKFAWKSKPLADWSVDFHKLVDATQESQWCRLCTLVAQRFGARPARNSE